MADVRKNLVDMLWEYDQLRMMRMSIEECADYLIANGVTIQRWIPVTERLPEKGGNYLCIVKSSLFRGATYQTILGYDKAGFYDGCIFVEDVTHWMPLPEPPKEE